MLDEERESSLNLSSSYSLHSPGERKEGGKRSGCADHAVGHGEKEMEPRAYFLTLLYF